MNKLQRRKLIETSRGKPKLVFECWIEHIATPEWSDDVWVDVSYTITTDKKERVRAYGATVLDAARQAWKQAKRDFNKSLDWYLKRGYEWYSFDESEAPAIRVENHGHQLTLKRDLRYHCSICWQSFADLPNYGTCPAVPVFSGMWDDAFPAAEKYLGFKPLTKGQLDKAGYQTGTKLPVPCAAVHYGENPNGLLFVYNPADAIPKKSLSDAQKAALAKAQEASRQRYICSRCDTRLEQHEYGKGNCDRCKAIAIAQSILNNNHLILDTETTGLSSDSEIVELAIIDCEGAILMNTRIRPRNLETYDDEAAGAIEVHGISGEYLQNAPLFSDLYSQLAETINGRNLVIYNADFDMPILRNMCEAYQVAILEPQSVICAMNLYAQYIGHWSDKRRSYRWYPLEGSHDALGDCRATLRVLTQIATCEVRKIRGYF